MAGKTSHITLCPGTWRTEALEDKRALTQQTEDSGQGCPEKLSMIDRKGLSEPSRKSPAHTAAAAKTCGPEGRSDRDPKGPKGRTDRVTIQNQVPLHGSQPVPLLTRVPPVCVDGKWSWKACPFPHQEESRAVVDTAV